MVIAAIATAMFVRCTKVLMAALLYKIVNNLTVFPEAPLTSRVVHYPYSTRYVHELSFCNLNGHTSQHLYSYFPDTIKLWNSLPYGVVSCNSLSTFKRAVFNLYVLFMLVAYSTSS